MVKIEETRHRWPSNNLAKIPSRKSPPRQTSPSACVLWRGSPLAILRNPQSGGIPRSFLAPIHSRAFGTHRSRCYTGHASSCRKPGTPPRRHQDASSGRTRRVRGPTRKAASAGSHVSSTTTARHEQSRAPGGPAASRCFRQPHCSCRCRPRGPRCSRRWRWRVPAWVGGRGRRRVGRAAGEAVAVGELERADRRAGVDVIGGQKRGGQERLPKPVLTPGALILPKPASSRELQYSPGQRQHRAPHASVVGEGTSTFATWELTAASGGRRRRWAA